jgi:hypothetical protein
MLGPFYTDWAAVWRYEAPARIANRHDKAQNRAAQACAFPHGQIGHTSPLRFGINAKDQWRVEGPERNQGNLRKPSFN